MSAPTLDASGNQYRATLNNDYDYAESSPATLTVTGTAPAAPQSSTATQTGPGEVTVTWAPPVSSGDSAVTGYDVGYGAGEYGDGLTVGPEIRSHVFSGLSNGAYTFSVAAVNLAGNGDRVRQPLTVGAYTPPTPRHPRHRRARRRPSARPTTRSSRATPCGSAASASPVRRSPSTVRSSATPTARSPHSRSTPPVTTPARPTL